MSYGFVDKVTISVYAGKGGDGAVTFHREKFVAAGGPDGGDGGRGGDVILVVDDHMSTLMDFRYKRKFVAANGENGLNKRCSGKDGENVTIRVPRGTLVRDKATGGIMADMSTGEPFVAARGGRGGWGNQHFATPTRQVPRFAKPGMPGEEPRAHSGTQAARGRRSCRLPECRQIHAALRAFPARGRRSRTITSRPSPPISA